MLLASTTFPPRGAVCETDAPGVLVKPGVARAQLDAEAAPVPGFGGGATAGGGDAFTARPGPGGTGALASAVPTAAPKPRRFHGSVSLDPMRSGRDAGRIADEVITHLSGLVGAQVTVTLEIQAEIPGGVPENVVGTVTENARTLKFMSQGFEVD